MRPTSASGTRSPIRRNSPGGFTLLEIVVVALIIGMVTVVAVGGIRRQPKTELAEAARALLSVAESCRGGAVLAGAPRTLVYSLDARQAWVEIPHDTDPTAPPKRVLETELPSAVRFASVLLDRETGIREGEVRLRMEPSGFCPAHLVHLEHADGGLERTVVIAPFPGHSRTAETAPDWDRMLESRVEEDAAGGVKALEEQ